MLVKLITMYGKPAVLACDGCCDKAWGINNRPSQKFPGDVDDYAFLADAELGEAPEDPGTCEGGFAKPTEPGERLNRWCARECERSAWSSEPNVLVQLDDFSKRRYNQPWKHEEAAGGTEK